MLCHRVLITGIINSFATYYKRIGRLKILSTVIKIFNYRYYGDACWLSRRQARILIDSEGVLYQMVKGMSLKTVSINLYKKVTGTRKSNAISSETVCILRNQRKKQLITTVNEDNYGIFNTISFCRKQIRYLKTDVINNSFNSISETIKGRSLKIAYKMCKLTARNYVRYSTLSVERESIRGPQTNEGTSKLVMCKHKHELLETNMKSRRSLNINNMGGKIILCKHKMGKHKYGTPGTDTRSRWSLSKIDGVAGKILLKRVMHKGSCKVGKNKIIKEKMLLPKFIKLQA